MIAKFDSVDQLAASGITIAGVRYMYLSSRDGTVKVVRAKKDRNGIQVTENLPARSEDWKGETLTPTYEQAFFHEMMSQHRFKY